LPFLQVPLQHERSGPHFETHWNARLHISQSWQRSCFLRQTPCSQTPQAVLSHAGSAPTAWQTMALRPRQSGRLSLHVVHGPQTSPAPSQRWPTRRTFASARLSPMAESAPPPTAAANPLSAPRRETFWAKDRAISSNRRSSNAMLPSANAHDNTLSLPNSQGLQHYDYLSGESIPVWSMLWRPRSVEGVITRSDGEVIRR
jgi:hypothetical protein